MLFCESEAEPAARSRAMTARMPEHTKIDPDESQQMIANGCSQWGHLQSREGSLGLPLQSNNIGHREFARLLKAAEVKRIILNVVRKGGFEPPRSCERQPLKLVRLPVPPLSRQVGLLLLRCRRGRLLG